MRKLIAVPVLTAVALLLTVSVARSSESDKLRERAQAVKKEAAELAKAGRGEEAEKLARKATELLEAAERLEGKHPKGSGPEAAGDRFKVVKFPGPLKELIEKERRMKESGASEKDLDEIRQRIAEAKAAFARPGFPGAIAGPKGPGPFGPPMPGFAGPGFPRAFAGFKGPGPFGHPMPEMMAKLEDAGRRIKHLRTAAENLRAAGADDLAKQLMEKAEIMEREARETKMRLAKEGEHRPGPKMGPFPVQFQEMRGEIERLRAEVNELRQHVKELERAKK